MRALTGILLFLLMHSVFADAPKLKLYCEGKSIGMVGESRPIPLSIIISATDKLLDQPGRVAYVVNSSTGAFDDFLFGVGQGRFVDVDENFIRLGQRFQSEHNDLEIQEITLNRFSGSVEISIRQQNKGQKDSEQRYDGVCKLADKARF